MRLLEIAFVPLWFFTSSSCVPNSSRFPRRVRASVPIRVWALSSRETSKHAAKPVWEMKNKQTSFFLTKLQYFTNLDFWWNKGMSLPQLPFGVRSCELALICPADLCSITAADFRRLSNICRRVLAASGNLRLQKRQQASSMDLAPGIGVNLVTQFVGKNRNLSTNHGTSEPPYFVQRCSNKPSKLMQYSLSGTKKL